MYNIEQISRGVSPQRVAEYKKNTESIPGSLKLKTIVRVGFAISVVILLICYKIYG